jgi:hypothetical protein
MQPIFPATDKIAAPARRVRVSAIEDQRDGPLEPPEIPGRFKLLPFKVLFYDHQLLDN